MKNSFKTLLKIDKIKRLAKKNEKKIRKLERTLDKLAAEKTDI